MAITIDIDTARPYQVHVGTFLLEQAGPLVRATAGGSRAVIVTDTNVGPLYQMPVKQSLESAGYEVSICTFEAGEAHKRAETYVAILEFVAEHELSRSDVIVALGGGVVGGGSMGGSSGGASDDSTGVIVWVKSKEAPANAILEPDPTWDCPEGFWAVPVEVGLSDNSKVEITRGLAEGQEVFIGYQNPDEMYY